MFRSRRARPRSLLAGSPRQVLPWLVFVQPDLRRQPEHPLGDDVAQDLRAPALDRVALGTQEPISGVVAVEVGALRPPYSPVAIQQPAGAEQIHLEPGDFL